MFRVLLIHWAPGATEIRALSEPIELVPACQLVEFLRRQYESVTIVPSHFDVSNCNAVIDAAHQLAQREWYTADGLCKHLAHTVAKFSIPANASEWVRAGAENIAEVAGEQLAAARRGRLVQLSTN